MTDPVSRDLSTRSSLCRARRPRASQSGGEGERPSGRARAEPLCPEITEGRSEPRDRGPSSARAARRTGCCGEVRNPSPPSDPSRTAGSSFSAASPHPRSGTTSPLGSTPCWGAAAGRSRSAVRLLGRLGRRGRLGARRRAGGRRGRPSLAAPEARAPSDPIPDVTLDAWWPGCRTEWGQPDRPGRFPAGGRPESPGRQRRVSHRP